MPRTHARTCTRETRIARPRPPTVTGNSPKFSSPSLLPRFPSIERSGSVTCSLQCNRSGSVRAQRLARVQLEPMPRTHARTCTRETRIARPRPPTVTGNSPKFSSPSLLPRFFPSWTAQRMSCSCVSGPPRTKSPFSVGHLHPPQPARLWWPPLGILFIQRKQPTTTVSYSSNPNHVRLDSLNQPPPGTVHPNPPTMLTINPEVASIGFS